LLVFEGTYVRLLLHRPRDATRPPTPRDYLANGVSGGFHQSVSAAGYRSARVIANAALAVVAVIAV
jgi:hypothetical protein